MPQWRLASVLEIFQVELLLAEFFSSITITVLAVSTHSSNGISSISPLWRGSLLLGMVNTVLSYRGVKHAVLLGGTDNFDLRKASVVWASLCALPLMCGSPLTLLFSLSFSGRLRARCSRRGPLTAHGRSFHTSSMSSSAAAELRCRNIARVALALPYIGVQVAFACVFLQARQARMAGEQ